jgi:hypothetical protein
MKEAIFSLNYVAYLYKWLLTTHIGNAFCITCDLLTAKSQNRKIL